MSPLDPLCILPIRAGLQDLIVLHHLGWNGLDEVLKLTERRDQSDILKIALVPGFTRGCLLLDQEAIVLECRLNIHLCCSPKNS